MTDLSMFESQAIGSAQRLAPRIWVIIWLGLGLLVPGLLITDTAISLGFTISSTTLFAVALLVIGLNRKYLASAQHFHDSLDVFVHNDAVLTFFATENGEITYANQAARARFAKIEEKSLVLVLGTFAANPVSAIFRLQNKARLTQSAHQDIVTDKGHTRLSVHYICPKGFIWRLEDLIERRENGVDTSEPIAMPMLLVNSDGRVLHMNRAIHNLLGRRIGHIDRLFRDLPIRLQGLHRILTDQGVITVRVLVYDLPNGRREVYLVPGLADGADGAGTGRLIDDLPVALVKISDTGKVIEANVQAAALVGLPIDKDTLFSDLVQGLGRPVSDWLRDTLEGRVPGRPEIVQARTPAAETYLQVSLSRVFENDNAILIAVLSDATELKKLEAQFVQSQKMQAIGQLAGGVAHDFNNLLTAISGYCDLLLLRHDEGDPDYGDLVQINQNSNRAASLVNQLLAFSRKQNLQPETLDLRETLTDLSHLLNRLLGEKVSLSVKHCDRLAAVRADKRQLEQVIMNLVVNARDAMLTGGEVGIETENVTLNEPLMRDSAEVPPGDYVAIRIIDSGCGIPAEKRTKIFEPFFTTKKTGEGTGLGLSMVYGIVKQTGGFIFVDSTVGQGSVFEILLPAFQAKKVVGKPPTVTPARPGTMREKGVILLVEDEVPVRRFAARALRMRGYEVLEAGDASEALDLLKDADLHIDVFVTDVIMPGKDGPTWVREARKLRPDVKVVFVSGYAEESFAEQQAGIANSVFLPKPFSLGELTEKVRQQIAC